MHRTTQEIERDFGFNPMTIGKAGNLCLYTGSWIIDTLDDLDRSVGASEGDLVVCTSERPGVRLCPTATAMPSYLGAIDHPTGAPKRGHRHYYFKKLGA